MDTRNGSEERQAGLSALNYDLMADKPSRGRAKRRVTSRFAFRC